MAIKTHSEQELLAWDQFAAAAIPTAAASISGSNKHEITQKIASRAAEIADAMIQQRRERD